MNATSLTIRPASRDDLASIVRMLADDALGAQRECAEEPLSERYIEAFEAIATDINNELVVADSADSVVGVLQLTFIPYLTYQGSWRALIEGVRVANALHAQGLGRQLFEWAIERARQRNCPLIQLTTNKQRPDALRFYERLGFVASHEGMKLHLTD